MIWSDASVSPDEIVKTLTVGKGGQYKLTIRDAHNCRVSDSLTVAYPLNLTAQVTNVICNGGDGGAIAASVTGGSGAYSYKWTGVDASGAVINIKNDTEPQISNLKAGVYTLRVEDKSPIPTSPSLLPSQRSSRSRSRLLNLRNSRSPAPYLTSPASLLPMVKSPSL